MNSTRFDENLIARISVGDADAFRQLYEATKSSVYGLALSFLKNRNDAEDVMHDTYLRVFDAAAEYQPMGKPAAWLLRITRNLCMNKLRETHRDAPEDESLPDARRHEEAAENRLIVDAALEQLGDSEREIILLHAVAGYKHREIASELELPLSTVLSRYHRTLKKLKSYLQSKGVSAK